jgi:DNA-binding NtrC family response regulator
VGVAVGKLHLVDVTRRGRSRTSRLARIGREDNADRVEKMAHILLVDDDKAAVAASAAAIELLGHSVTASSTTAEAREAIHRETPDLVVLEAVLGGKTTGIDLAKSLAKEYPQLPLIMLTRADERFSRNELARQDRDGWIPVKRYLEKPVLGDVLAYEVEHQLLVETRA